MADNAANRSVFPPSALLTVLPVPAPSLPAASTAETLTALGELAPAFDLEWIVECDSTNRVLMETAPRDDGRMQVLVADRQHAGRGRRGRQWESWPGGSLTFSLRRRFAAGAPVPAGLSLVAGLAVARALDALGVPGIALKWPNDILHGDAKLGGILVELQASRARAASMSAVIGIGLNLRLPPNAAIRDQPGVTDLAALLAAAPAPATVLAAVLAELHALLARYEKAGFPALRDAWQARNAHAGRTVQIRSETDAFAGECIGVDDDGALLVRAGEHTRRVLAGDVSLRALHSEST